MKMDVVDLVLIGALKHESALQVGRRLVPLKTAKRLWVELSLHVLTEGAVPTRFASMNLALLGWDSFTLLV